MKAVLCYNLSGSQGQKQAGPYFIHFFSASMERFLLADGGF